MNLNMTFGVAEFPRPRATYSNQLDTQELSVSSRESLQVVQDMFVVYGDERHIESPNSCCCFPCLLRIGEPDVIVVQAIDSPRYSDEEEEEEQPQKSKSPSHAQGNGSNGNQEDEEENMYAPSDDEQEEGHAKDDTNTKQERNDDTNNVETETKGEKDSDKVKKKKKKKKKSSSSSSSSSKHKKLTKAAASKQGTAHTGDSAEGEEDYKKFKNHKSFKSQVVAHIRKCLKEYYRAGLVHGRDEYKQLAQKFTNQILDAQCKKLEKQYNENLDKYRKELERYEKEKKDNMVTVEDKPKEPELPSMRYSEETTAPRIDSFVKKWFGKRRKPTYPAKSESNSSSNLQDNNTSGSNKAEKRGNLDSEFKADESSAPKMSLYDSIAQDNTIGSTNSRLESTISQESMALPSSYTVVKREIITRPVSQQIAAETAVSKDHASGRTEASNGDYRRKEDRRSRGDEDRRSRGDEERRSPPRHRGRPSAGRSRSPRSRSPRYRSRSPIQRRRFERRPNDRNTRHSRERSNGPRDRGRDSRRSGERGGEYSRERTSPQHHRPLSHNKGRTFARHIDETKTERQSSLETQPEPVKVDSPRGKRARSTDSFGRERVKSTKSDDQPVSNSQVGEVIDVSGEGTSQNFTATNTVAVSTVKDSDKECGDEGAYDPLSAVLEYDNTVSSNAGGVVEDLEASGEDGSIPLDYGEGA